MSHERRAVIPPQHSRPVGSYSPGVAVTLHPGAKLIFVSGQVATDAEGRVLHKDDPNQQAKVVFQRIQSILEQAGAQMSNLVSLTIYLIDISHFDTVSSVRNEVLATPPPSSTLVEISALVEKGCLVEISAVAVL